MFIAKYPFFNPVLKYICIQKNLKNIENGRKLNTVLVIKENTYWLFLAWLDENFPIFLKKSSDSG